MNIKKSLKRMIQVKEFYLNNFDGRSNKFIKETQEDIEALKECLKMLEGENTNENI